VTTLLTADTRTRTSAKRSDAVGVGRCALLAVAEYADDAVTVGADVISGVGLQSDGLVGAAT
jgi:hypothetical protein